MSNITITINGKQIEAAEGTTILEAARANGIKIPTLCYLKELDPRASCRMCVVEIEGRRGFQPSCATRISEGMVIHTDTEELRKKRKLTLELIMAHHPVDCHHCLRIGNSKEEDLDPTFCEMCFWCDCERDGICELQALNREYHVDKLPFELKSYTYETDSSLGSITRNNNKCVKCRRCVDVCNDVQTVHNLALYGRAQEFHVTSSMNKPMSESLCVRCGRCVDVCPTGALYMKESIDAMLCESHSHDRQTVGMVSTSILKGLEDLNKMQEGTLDLHKVIGGMKKLGVKCIVSEEQVIDACKAEAEEIILAADGPVILSNSFAVKQFVNQYYAELSDKIRYFSSTQEKFGKMAQEELADTFGWGSSNIKTVVFSDNNENGAEAAEEHTVDFSMNAREVYRLFMRTGVDLTRIRPTDPVRLVPGRRFDYEAVTGPVAFSYDKEPEVRKINGKKCAVAHNLGQVRKLLDEVKSGTCSYDVIRLGA